MEKDLNDKKENQADLADLSMLPDGVSKFDIDDNEVTIYKNGDDIQTQIVGDSNPDLNEIYKKVKTIIESK